MARGIGASCRNVRCSSNAAGSSLSNPTMKPAITSKPARVRSSTALRRSGSHLCRGEGRRTGRSPTCVDSFLDAELGARVVKGRPDRHK